MTKYLMSIEGDVETNMTKEELKADLKIKGENLKIDVLSIEIERLDA